MTELEGEAGRFLALHHGDRPLLQPNAWDIGSAKVLAALGFEAIATTSGGFAATLGRLDGSVTREEALAHGSLLAAAVDVPVAADTENGFADDPSGVAETVSLVCGTGLAGCSIEDFSGRPNGTIYDIGLAAERVAAAVEAAHRGPTQVVLTARAENLIHGREDLADTIARLQAYQEAGADVLFAPGLSSMDDIRSVLAIGRSPRECAGCAGMPTGRRAGGSRRRPHLRRQRVRLGRPRRDGLGRHRAQGGWDLRLLGSARRRPGHDSRRLQVLKVRDLPVVSLPQPTASASPCNAATVSDPRDVVTVERLIPVAPRRSSTCSSIPHDIGISMGRVRWSVRRETRLLSLWAPVSPWP